MTRIGLRIWRASALTVPALSAVLTCNLALAQDVNAGKLAYTTPQVAGRLSCSASACHGSNPLNNQNRILKAADNPGGIGVALNSVSQMAFLRGNLTTQQFIDLAAYIGNPAGATGTPVAQLAPASLSFGTTVVGNSALAQIFAINNTGTAALVVSGISSSNADFTVVSSCGNIAASNSCNVSVGFTPSSAGTRSGTITVTHNASGGASTITVSGTATAPVVLTPGITAAPASVAFGSVALGSFSGAQFVVVTSSGNAPLTLNAISIAGNNFAVLTGSGSCAVASPIATGVSCTVGVRFQPTSEGVLSGTLSLSHNASPTMLMVGLSGTGVANISAPAVKTMVEYVYTPLNYFFITSRDDDKATLDKVAGFQRTGLSFPVYATQTGNARAIARFYFDKVAMNASRGSHFYTLLDADKTALAGLNPTNAQTPRLPFNEGVDSWAFLPVLSGVGGSCASGQMPVFRLFRNSGRFPDDPNHRFTSDVATYNAYVALGWDGEGVNFCVPLP